MKPELAYNSNKLLKAKITESALHI